MSTPAISGPETGGKAAFLSHSSSDSSIALELCNLLEARGASCWIAPRDVTPGRPYAEECVRGIETSIAFVLLASASAVSSVQVLAEVEQAHKRRKPIYTILIGKPTVTKELDYYISRLHWIEHAGSSTDEIAGRLATVLLGKDQWQEVASPPSLRRTILYRRDAFVGSAVATLLVLLLAGAGLWYWVHRAMGRLDLDFRSLGQVTFSTPGQIISGGKSIRLSAEVWVLAEAVHFGEARFVTAAQGSDGRIERADQSAQFLPDQVGAAEVIQVSVPAGSKKLTTCVVVPSPRRHEHYRVTQEFSLLLETGDSVAISRISEPKVTLDDATACGAP
jgi:hypothetical protein